MFCPNCGKQINDNSKFCAYCGHKFEEKPQIGRASCRERV